MDSLNTLKGYGKLGTPADDLSSARTARIHTGVKAFLLLSLSLFLLAALVLALARIRSHEEEPNSADAIKSVCNVTLHPDSCFSSLSSSSSADPRDLLILSLHVSVASLRGVSDIPHRLSSGVNDSMVKEALGTCTEQIQDALDNLNTSLSLLTPPANGGKPLLDKAKIEDLRTYLSAVLTDIDTCLDGFEGTTGGFLEKLQAALKNSTDLASNSLAIATHVLSLLGNVHRKLLTMEPI